MPYVKLKIISNQNPVSFKRSRIHSISAPQSFIHSGDIIKALYFVSGAVQGSASTAVNKKMKI